MVGLGTLDWELEAAGVGLSCTASGGTQGLTAASAQSLSWKSTGTACAGAGNSLHPQIPKDRLFPREVICNSAFGSGSLLRLLNLMRIWLFIMMGSEGAVSVLGLCAPQFLDPVGGIAPRSDPGLLWLLLATSITDRFNPINFV